MATGSIHSTALPPAPPAPSESIERERLIQRQLARASVHMRLVDLASGLLLWLTGVLLLFIVAAVFDHVVGLGMLGRCVMLAVLVAASLWYLLLQVAPLLVRAINPAYAAKTIEEATPSLKNSLINFLLLRQDRSGIREIVYQAVEKQAATDIAGVPVETTIDRSRLIHAGYFLCGVMAVLAAYKILSPKDPFQTVARVLAPWADIARPSRVEIFDIDPGNCDVYYGQPVAISATIRGLRTSDKVNVHFSTADAQIIDQPVAMQRTAGDRFECTLPPPGAAVSPLAAGLQQNTTYRIVAGDAESPLYRLNVISAPTIIVERLEYQYPAYTKKPPEIALQQGDIKALEGTKVKLYALANQPIRAAWLEMDPVTSEGAAELVNLTAEGERAQGTLTLLLKEDRLTPWRSTYQLRFHNDRAEKSQQPIVHKIEVIRDLAPEVQIIQPERLRTEVHEDGELPIEVRAVDPDFGLSALRIEGSTAAKAAVRVELLEDATNHPPQTAATYAFRPREHQLKAGDELIYVAVAEDNRVSPQSGQAEPNVTRTKEYQIIVLPPQNKPGEQAKEPNQGQKSPGKQSPQQDGKQQPKQSDGRSDQRQQEQPQGAKGNHERQAEQPQERQEKSQQQDGQKQEGQKQEGPEQEGPAQPGEKQAGQPQQQGDQQQTGQQSGQQKGQQSSDSQQQSGSDAQQQSGGGQQGSGNQTAGQQSEPSEGGQGASAGQQSGQSTGQRSGEPGSGKSGGQPPSGDQQDQRDDQGKAEHDGQAIERLLEELKRRGETGGQEGDAQPYQGQQGPAGQQQGSKGQTQGKSGDQQSGTPDSGRPESSDQQPAQGQSAQQGQQQTERADRLPGEKQGDSSAEQPGSGAKGGIPEGPTKTDKSEKSSDGQGEKRDAGAGKQGGEGAGEQASDKTGSGPGAQKNADREKQQEANGSQAEKGETSPISDSQRQSDSKGGESGDRSGGGKQGAGQSSGQEGNDSAGSQSAADQGAGKAQESGSGDTGSKAGEGQQAADKTGQSGNQKGAGSGQKAGGDQSGDSPEGQPPEGQPSEGTSGKTKDGSRRSQKGGSTSGSDPVGGSDDGRERTPPPATSAEDQAADAANLEYARRATEMVLRRLKEEEHNPDPELLDKLGWTREDLAEFLRRWEALQKSASESPDGKRDLDEALKSLGLRDPANRRRAGGTVSDQQRDLRDAGNRSSAPPRYRDLFDAFRKGAARSQE